MLKKAFLILLSFIIISGNEILNAQDSPPVVTRSQTIQVVDGKEYFFHPVLQGQTLFSIARAYGVSQEDIYEANPELRDHGLRFDQIIRIPVKHDDKSQQVTSGTLKETTWIEHQVRRRETVYGISRQYGISQEDLLRNNPHARAGLRPNMILRIPRQSERIVSYIEYTVPPGQTMFSLTREFNVSNEEIEKLNPQLKDGLKAGQTLRIPAEAGPEQQPPFIVEPRPFEVAPEYPEDPIAIHPYCDDPILKEYYNVALLIPLYLERVDTEFAENPDSRHPSFAFMQYYEGLLIALDSVRRMGADIRLSVFDVCDDPGKAHAVLRKPEMANMDLIIGPFNANTMDIVAQFAMRRNIPVVSPLHWEDNRQLVSYPILFQATPSIQTQMNDMAKFVARNYANDNIILVHNNQPLTLINSYKATLNRELNYIDYYRDSLNLAKIDGYFLNGVYVGERLTNVYVLHDSLLQPRLDDKERSLYEQYMQRESMKEVVYSLGGMDKIKDMLDANRRNILVTPMGGEAIISDYTRQLNQMRDTFDITVLGVPQWRDYRSLDYRYLQNLRVHLFTSDFIDYDKKFNIDFIRRYRKENHVEPDIVAFRAVHTGMFFFSALMQYGSDFHKCTALINRTKSSGSPFRFYKAFGESGGWENNFVYIFKYENYRLKDVKEPDREITRLD
ncbi:MAG: LysM peptidoglycan-binding domain-containing protein [Bacteroidales bacterium]|nr:LysM peptidoglycan-binding domain-containing protein [Bacteroidales bacterium]